MKFNWKRERIWFAAMGMALAAAGFFRYNTQGEMTRLNEGLLIGGGVLVLIALVLSYREIGGFFGHRSTKLGTNTAVLTLLVVAILGLVNFFGYRHDKSLDLTTEGLYSLSNQTHRVLGNLHENIQLILFAKNTDQRFQDLAQAYQTINPRVHYETVDPQEHPEVARQYNVTELNKTIVTNGTRTETIDNDDEQDLTNAILKLTRNTVKTVCFVSGHGERPITGDGADTYSGMVQDLSAEGYIAKDVNLVSADTVPAECSALVDAGPKEALFPQETQIIAKYLDNGGKVLFLLDPETDPKIDNVLNQWNVKLGSNVVVDASGVGRLFNMGPGAPMVVTYGDSPITKNFNGTMTFFPLARTVSIANKSSQQPSEVELLKTSERTFTVPNLNTREVHFDPATDQAGPLVLGVTAEQTEGSGDGAKKARLVVIGNSAFATNQWAGLQRNGDLFLNTIHWLSEDEDLISIRPKLPTARRVIITDTQQSELYWSTIILLPAFVMISGVVLWIRRR